MTIKTTKPLWALIHPALFDKDKVIAVYQEGKTQVGASRIIGCCDKTFRKALKYHGIVPPFLRIPSRILMIFRRESRKGDR